jgi:divalent metal cation (Fe/Co/Zn/Cd) transporter
MDAALATGDLEIVKGTLERLGNEDIRFSNLRTRRAGYRNFVYLDVLVPGHWSVHEAHLELDRIEHAIAQALPDTTVFTHAEPGDRESATVDARTLSIR